MNNVLSLPRQIAMEDIGVSEEVGRFLKTIIPDTLVNDGADLLERLHREDIESLILDRLPFLCVDRAVILRSGEEFKIVSVSTITNDMCEGHFGIKSIIPLIIFSKVMALTGSILLSWMYHQEDNPVPLAVRGEGVHSVTQKLVTPPATVICEVTFQKKRLQYCTVAANVWIGDIQVAEIARLGYMLVDKTYLLNT